LNAPFRILLLTVGLLGVERNAHAWTFQPFGLTLSVESGPRMNVLRLREGTRQTPAVGWHSGLSGELMLFAPWWTPHRVSLVAALWPDAQATYDLPIAGRHPGLAFPPPEPGLVRWPALGVGASAGMRYRWETDTVVVPFMEADVLLRAHKTLTRSPPHVNLALRTGGGLEYWLLHRVAVFAAFRIQSGPMLWPLPYVVPYWEVSSEMTLGARIRAF
jgi:hypothetical protein